VRRRITLGDAALGGAKSGCFGLRVGSDPGLGWVRWGEEMGG
jgi:hypothetical protein